MKIDYITLAIPFFLLLIIIEVVASFVKKRGYYGYHDSVNDLSAGINQQVVGILTDVLRYLLYVLVYEHFRIFTFSATSVVAWIIGAIGVDFLYYWFHRATHEVAIIWGSHLPHHQSEEYNLTVALRQGAFQKLFSIWFYLPLAIIGVPFPIFFANEQFSTIYQFWIHTRAIGKLGFLEIFLNTPSHHRVHHGKNPKYIDKNYAATLIIWDKIFGTFEPESEEAVYGTIKPLASWNPIWAQIHYFGEIIAKIWKAPHISDKFKIAFKGPGWLPRGLEFDSHNAQSAYTKEGIEKGIKASYPPKFDTDLSPILNAYTFVQFVLTLTIASFFFFKAPTMTLVQQIPYAAFIVISLAVIGGIFENRKWAHFLEIHRQVVISIGLCMVLSGPALILAVVPIAMAIFYYMRTLGASGSARHAPT